MRLVQHRQLDRLAALRQPATIPAMWDPGFLAELWGYGIRVSRETSTNSRNGRLERNSAEASARNVPEAFIALLLCGCDGKT